MTAGTELPAVEPGWLTTLKWRDEVVRFLRGRGVPAGRPLRPLSGPWRDGGEIDGLDGWTLLARRQRYIDLPACMDAATERAARDGNRYAAAVIYRRAKDVDQAWVLQPLSQFAELLCAADVTRRSEQ